MLSLAVLCFSIGITIAVSVVSLAGGYILAVSVLDRFSKTVLGTHIRHAFVRMAPPKRFDPTDGEIVQRIIIDEIQRRGSKIRKLLKERARD